VTAEQLTDALRARFPDLSVRPVDTAPSATVEPATLHGHMRFLRDELAFDMLEAVYRLFCSEARASLMVRVVLPRRAARVPTVSDIFRTAEWHEREAAEMFGIEFEGHPDPRRLLLPDDLEGHPLLKDFTHPNLRRLPETA